MKGSSGSESEMYAPNISALGGRIIQQMIEQAYALGNESGYKTRQTLTLKPPQLSHLASACLKRPVI